MDKTIGYPLTVINIDDTGGVKCKCGAVNDYWWYHPETLETDEERNIRLSVGGPSGPQKFTYDPIASELRDWEGHLMADITLNKERQTYEVKVRDGKLKERLGVTSFIIQLIYPEP